MSRAFVLRWMVSGVFLIACGQRGTPRSAEGPVEDAAAPAVAIDAAVVTSVDAGVADASIATVEAKREPPHRCGHLRWVPQFCYVRDLGDPSAATFVEEDAWLRAHGARPASVKAQTDAHLLGVACREISAGPDKEGALLCIVQTQTKSADPMVYRGLQRARVVAVRKGTVAVLLDVPLSFSNFDAVGQPSGDDETEIFGMTIDPREAATKIVVAEPRPGECAAATKQSATDLSERLKQKPLVPIELTTMRFDAKLLGTICAAAKTYAWTNGTYTAR